MTEKIATPVRDGLSPSILAPTTRMRVPVWVLAVSVLAAFALGWAVAGIAPGPGGTDAAPGQSQTAAPEPVDTSDDSGFVRVATRDLDDFDDDLDDIDTTLDEDGFWRLLSNVVELNFNVSQLQQAAVPPSIAEDWATGLAELEAGIDTLEKGVTAGSDSKVRAAVVDLRNTVEGLRGVVSRVD